MNVRTQPSPAGALAGAGIAEIERRLTTERVADIRAIEPEWRALEAGGLGTVFQRFDWVDAYLRNVARHEGVEQAAVIGRIDGTPAFILPLGIRKQGPARIAHWLGGSHSGYNPGLWSRQHVEAMARLGRSGLVRTLRKALRGVDGALLERIPADIDGIPCPLAALTSLPSPVMGYSVSLEGGIDAVITRTGGGARRRRARSKERRMGDIAPVTRGIVTDRKRGHEALGFFAEQKALRLAEQDLPNVFAEPGVMDFFHDLLDRSAGMQEPLLQIATLDVGDRTRAVIGSGVHAGRVNLYILTFIHDETLPHSPGQVLMYRHIEESCEAGHAVFDFGVGYELYKESWADARIALRDGYAAFTPLGMASVGALWMKDGAKSILRRNDKLWAKLKATRSKAKDSETRDAD